MPPEIEQRSRAEVSPLWEDLEAQNERLRKLDEDFLQGSDRETRDKIEFYRRECSLLREEIETSGHGSELERDNPTNLAINATETSLSTKSSARERSFNRHAEILFAEPTEAMEGLPELRRRVVEAHDTLSPRSQQGSNTARLVLAVSLGLVLVGGLTALLTEASTPTTTTTGKPRLRDNGTVPELNRRAELTGLLLQAAANRPLDAGRYGISPERFQAMRQALVVMVQSLAEEQYWEQLAQAAESGYGSQGDPYTLGDHFYALDLAFTLLEPLVDPQPCELDLDTWIPELQSAWQSGERARAGGGVPQLYRSIIEIVADDSGATRLTRLFLARAALAQVAELQSQATPRTLSGKSRLASGMNWSSFFQISGAAMFCLPPPFMAYGYLANTVLEVFVGGAESGESFFKGLNTALQSIDQRLQQIELKQLLGDLQALKEPIEAYKQSLQVKYNERGRSGNENPNDLPSLEFFYDPNPTEFQGSLIGRLEKHFNDPTELWQAVSRANNMWAYRQSYDSKGEWSLLLWLLVAYTSYLSCSRQLATTYATIANLYGNTNHQELPDPAWTDSYRPNRKVLLSADGDANMFAYWTSKHWSQVSTHIKLVKSDYVWPESLESKKNLWNARLSRSESGQSFYDRAWFIFIDLWRRGQITLSMPTEIYRWVERIADDPYSEGYFTSKGFAHGWPASQLVLDNKTALDSADSDLLPPEGSSTKTGTRQWLRNWYSDLCKLQKKRVPWLNPETAMITPVDQTRFLDGFEAIFTIGVQHNATWTYFFLKTIREQLQAWRVSGDVSLDIGIETVDRIHGMAWPTTGELNRIIRQLDQSVPCSWQSGPDYLKTVIHTLKIRWQEMANSGTDPSKLSWMAGETFWWLDRSDATYRPMPLLPETIVLALEVWLAGAIRADRLQKPIRGDLSAHSYYNDDEATFLTKHLSTNHCKFTADDHDLGNIAYQIPEYLGPLRNHLSEDSPNDREFYDNNREKIRQAWVRKREEVLDQILSDNYGLAPSDLKASPSEAMAQNWLNGLLDMNDDLKLRTPDKLINDIQPHPGLLRPTYKASLWQSGNTVSYSYQLRALSSFKELGSDSLSEESKLSAPLLLDETTSNSGIAIQIPRDDDMLGSQILLWRTLTDPNKPTNDLTRTSKNWIGTGHFDPGQTQPCVFHDGNPPIPRKLDIAAITPEPTTKPPKGTIHWVKGNKVQYVLQYFDAAGRGNGTPSMPSELSEPIEISNDTCGLKLTIPSDSLGVATSVQIKRTIIDSNGKILEDHKTLERLYPFPASNHPGPRVIEVLDADITPPPDPIVFSLKMTTQGLELRRTDQATPVWTSKLWDQNPLPLTSCRMQVDGNLVIYDKNMKAYWASNTMENEANTNSNQALRLQANGELAIVSSIKDPRTITVLVQAAQPPLPLDRPDVFLRSGETMLPDQVLSINNQSPNSHY